MRRILGAIPIAFAIVLGACPEPETVVIEQTAAEHGKDLFDDASIAGAAQNRLACSHCHTESEADEPSFKPGGPLAGATKRPTYWGNQESTLLRSINDCLYFFMAADAPWEGDEDEAVSIYAYLESLESGGDEPAYPFTIGDVVDPGSGDGAHGEAVYEGACATCHGAKSTADGRLLPIAPTLPEETLANHPDPDYDDADRRLVFVEKVRHGGFLGYGGSMPPFSVESLSDQDLADLLTYLGVPEP